MGFMERLLISFSKSLCSVPTFPTWNTSVLSRTVGIFTFLLEYNDHFKIHEFSMDLRMRCNLKIVTADKSCLYGFW